MIIGLDSLYKLCLVLNAADKTWYYQSCPKELFPFVDDDSADATATIGEKVLHTIATLEDLSKHQKTKLDTLNSELPHFDKVSGRFTQDLHSATSQKTAFFKLPSLLAASKQTLDLDPMLPQEWVNRISVLQEVYLLVRNNLGEGYKKAS
jgi:hypothetical protein